MMNQWTCSGKKGLKPRVFPLKSVNPLICNVVPCLMMWASVLVRGMENQQHQVIVGHDEVEGCSIALRQSCFKHLTKILQKCA